MVVLLKTPEDVLGYYGPSVVASTAASTTTHVTCCLNMTVPCGGMSMPVCRWESSIISISHGCISFPVMTPRHLTLDDTSVLA